jgi:hypothetical protein
LDFAQPTHADTDVDQRMVEQETALVSPIAGVPAKESNTAGGDVVGKIVLGEIDLVVRGDDRDLGLAAHSAVVEPLAGVPA